jgi:hypothetical protein
MDLKGLSKPLEIKDIDFRVQSINKGKYATILAYKDARVDMNRLDEVCGAENWQRDHKIIGGNLYCGIGVYYKNENDPLADWVWKWDVGTESNTEAEKGQASDSFKRAGFNWGIGRELYDYPLIQIKLNADEFTVDNNKAKAAWKFQLKKWTWGSHFDSEQKLCILRVKDEGGKVRFEWYRLDLVQDAATFILKSLADGDLDAVGEAYNECAEFEQNLLWTAKSKGGWFDVEQKKAIRTAEYAFVNGKQQSNSPA